MEQNSYLTHAELVARVNRVQVSSPGGESGTTGGLITGGTFMSSSRSYRGQLL